MLMTLEEKLKYCIYFDGDPEGKHENELFSSYEESWCEWVDDPSQEKYLQENVREMIGRGVSLSWMESFGIPKTLIGIFFNRYCHWISLYDVEDFKKWFEDVRNKRIR